eukprot:11846298-Alexandrium_andersonii.AAC.1
MLPGRLLPLAWALRLLLLVPLLDTDAQASIPVDDMLALVQQGAVAAIGAVEPLMAPLQPGPQEVKPPWRDPHESP